MSGIVIDKIHLNVFIAPCFSARGVHLARQIRPQVSGRIPVGCTEPNLPKKRTMSTAQFEEGLRREVGADEVL